MSKLTPVQLESLLKLPNERKKPLKVVVDTDFNNEIDDFFALTYLLLPHENIKVEAIYAAPFSFVKRLDSLLAANSLIKSGVDNLTPAEQELVNSNRAQIESIEALGIDPESLAKGSHVSLTPKEGLDSSYADLVKFTKLFPDFNIPILKGADRYITDKCPVRSEAIYHLIDLARKTTIDDPIYIVGIAAATNLASAILLAPDIKDKIVVIWTAGYPVIETDLKNRSFNIDQDIFAAQTVFDSGVALVYIPGFYVGQQLNLTQNDVEAWFKTSGPIGEALYNRYMNNPLFDWYGLNKKDLFGQKWTIWDLIVPAWLINPDNVPSHIVKGVSLTEDLMWVPSKDAVDMRECYGVNYNNIFRSFATQLREYESKSK